MSNNHIKSEDIELKNVVNGILSKELLSDDMPESMIMSWKELYLMKQENTKKEI